MHRTEGQNNTQDSQGRLQFTDGPPGTTITAGFMNSVQEEICNVIETAGITVKTAGTDTRDQLYSAINQIATNSFDVVVSSQSIFNSVIERVGANQYKIKDGYRSVYIQYLSGGYQMSGATSPLAGGDTWGYIQTNNACTIFCDGGAFIDFGNTQGYIAYNTTGGLYYGMDVRGTGTVASAITRSHDVQANRVSLYFCKTNTRLSNTTFYCFDGSDYEDALFIGCIVRDIESSGAVAGFYQCHNIQGAYVNGLESTGSTCYAIYDSQRITNAYIYNLDSVSTTIGIRDSFNVSNCQIEQIDSSGGNAIGIYGTDRVSNCTITDVDSSAVAYGVWQCENVSSVRVSDVDSSGNVVRGFREVSNVSACTVYDIQAASTHDVVGFYDCDYVSACLVDKIDTTGAGGEAYGYRDCNYITGSRAKDIDAALDSAAGFYNCDTLSACHAEDIQSDLVGVGGRVAGFWACNRLSACTAYDLTDLGSDDTIGFYDCDRVTGCLADTIYSTEGDAFGYYNCKDVSGCAAETIDSAGLDLGDCAYGFHTCDRVSACSADDIDTDLGDAFGFYDCDYISACYATDIDSSGGGTANGFRSCMYGSSLYTSEALNSGCSHIDANDAQITVKYSTPAVFT